jgi:spoIIIJ-associated protein
MSSEELETQEVSEETSTVKEPSSIKDLEEEGEVAADYLEELLDIYDLDGDISIDVREGRAYIEISAEEGSNIKLISDPNTVEALQELTRIAVQTKTETFSRLILDIAGSRQAKVDSLTKLVNKVIAKVKETNAPVAMKPMSSYERKIAHDLIGEAGLISESEGEGKDRHIVAKPAQ